MASHLDIMDGRIVSSPHRLSVNIQASGHTSLDPVNGAVVQLQFGTMGYENVNTNSSEPIEDEWILQQHRRSKKKTVNAVQSTYVLRDQRRYGKGTSM